MRQIGSRRLCNCAKSRTSSAVTRSMRKCVCGKPCYRRRKCVQICTDRVNTSAGQDFPRSPRCAGSRSTRAGTVVPPRGTLTRRSARSGCARAGASAARFADTACGRQGPAKAGRSALREADTSRCRRGACLVSPLWQRVLDTTGEGLQWPRRRISGRVCPLGPSRRRRGSRWTAGRTRCRWHALNRPPQSATWGGCGSTNRR
jgi:hypothetical protein